jgi:hypothetical protein
MNRFFFVFLCLSLIALFSEKAPAQDGPPPTPEIVNAAAAAQTPTVDGPFQPTWDSLKQNYTAPQLASVSAGSPRSPSAGIAGTVARRSMATAFSMLIDARRSVPASRRLASTVAGG